MDALSLGARQLLGCDPGLLQDTGRLVKSRSYDGAVFSLARMLRTDSGAALTGHPAFITRLALGEGMYRRGTFIVKRHA